MVVTRGEEAGEMGDVAQRVQSCSCIHLAGYLKSRGLDVAQRDLSIKVARDVLLEYGDETTGETNACSRILSGEARVSITNYLDEISHTR